MNKKIIKIIRRGFAFNFVIADFKTQLVEEVYFIFSKTDPWFIPRYEPKYGKLKFPLYGWLFFYFGKKILGVIYEQKDMSLASIIDKNGKGYNVYTVSDDEIKDMIKQLVKEKQEFYVDYVYSEDGKEVILKNRDRIK